METNINNAIKYVQETYVEDSKGMPAMLLGNVAELIKILTGQEVDLKHFLEPTEYFFDTEPTTETEQEAVEELKAATKTAPTAGLFLGYMGTIILGKFLKPNTKEYEALKEIEKAAKAELKKRDLTSDKKYHQVCCGCGYIEGEDLGPTAYTCCPERKMVDLKHYLDNSKYIPPKE